MGLKIWGAGWHARRGDSRSPSPFFFLRFPSVLFVFFVFLFFWLKRKRQGISKKINKFLETLSALLKTLSGSVVKHGLFGHKAICLCKKTVFCLGVFFLGTLDFTKIC